MSRRRGRRGECDYAGREVQRVRTGLSAVALVGFFLRMKKAMVIRNLWRAEGESSLSRCGV